MAPASGASHLLPEPIQRPLISLFFKIRENDTAQEMAPLEQGEKS